MRSKPKRRSRSKLTEFTRGVDMTHSDYDEETGQRPTHSLRRTAALLPFRTWRNAAFLFGVFAVAGVGSAPLWSSAGNNKDTGEVSNNDAVSSSSLAGTASPGSSKAANSQKEARSSETELTVNGENIPLPSNGTYHSSTSNENGRSTLDVTINNQSSGTTNSTSTSIDFRSNSSSSSTTNAPGEHPSQ